mmetsp:Transcript_35605/g.98614  ORF Transcript_35605/g.98614 Transcript_35605/m.98614 type:complete len:216 (-) Transcript_35605:104-751(-)
MYHTSRCKLTTRNGPAVVCVYHLEDLACLFGLLGEQLQHCRHWLLAPLFLSSLLIGRVGIAQGDEAFERGPGKFPLTITAHLSEDRICAARPCSSCLAAAAEAHERCHALVLDQEGCELSDTHTPAAIAVEALEDLLGLDLPRARQSCHHYAWLLWLCIDVCLLAILLGLGHTDLLHRCGSLQQGWPVLRPLGFPSQRGEPSSATLGPEMQAACL